MTDLASLGRKIRPDHTAVLVIDMQNDFCDRAGAFGRLNPGLDFEAIEAMIPRLRSFVSGARAVGIPIVFIRAVYNADDDRYLSESWLEQARRRRKGLYTTIPVCKEGQWGAEIISDLTPASNDVVIEKHRYSAFIRTSLADHLVARGISTVITTGVATGGCVAATAQDGFMLDFTMVVVEDCVADSLGREVHEFATRHLDLLYAEVRSARDIQSAWRAELGGSKSSSGQ
jgi:ureidoacrylate peracid hydrolase